MINHYFMIGKVNTCKIKIKFINKYLIYNETKFTSNHGEVSEMQNKSDFLYSRTLKTQHVYYRLFLSEYRIFFPKNILINRKLQSVCVTPIPKTKCHCRRLTPYGTISSVIQNSTKINMSLEMKNHSLNPT